MHADKFTGGETKGSRKFPASFQPAHYNPAAAAALSLACIFIIYRLVRQRAIRERNHITHSLAAVYIQFFAFSFTATSELRRALQSFADKLWHPGEIFNFTRG